MRHRKSSMVVYGNKREKRKELRKASDILVTRLVDMGHKLGGQRQDQSEENAI